MRAMAGLRRAGSVPCGKGILLMVMLALAGAAGPARAAGPAEAAEAALLAPASDHLTGAYLAGREAQQLRDFPAAAAWFEKAIAVDPEAPELISRSFLMEASIGRLDRARALAPAEL